MLIVGQFLEFCCVFVQIGEGDGVSVSCDIQNLPWILTIITTDLSFVFYQARSVIIRLMLPVVIIVFKNVRSCKVINLVTSTNEYFLL